MHERARSARERTPYSPGSVEGLMETEHRQPAQRRQAMLCQQDTLAAWCGRWLGAPPTSVLFEVADLSMVTGLRLADGREVVDKARPPAARLQACGCARRVPRSRQC